MWKTNQISCWILFGCLHSIPTQAWSCRRLTRGKIDSINNFVRHTDTFSRRNSRRYQDLAHLTNCVIKQLFHVRALLKWQWQPISTRFVDSGKNYSSGRRGTLIGSLIFMYSNSNTVLLNKSLFISYSYIPTPLLKWTMYKWKCKNLCYSNSRI